ncbi:methyltransferase family protein [Saccharopolyspora erythraea NRRL 2338]|uniref:Methyltransferase n=2 Tax=Saccharopolyspora erythraea TaxID=1836 RepID=A4FG51_SACEN|nr:class I SAM-dependent methyltransferase [Saccharopolyspora erythraea]EQD85504.1 SAM-dependent methyltransferase [Saccharopolyspora erythraea D]PFG96731.1 methyltransferase family protein [Saccharopolyspora erythraea NRRL 2338]QRK86984.1 class I SAM-dependent methyltransferase [Saccharopolyspora erythraea]CAM03026.1 methyltransferase [Saccharopolyspora erythraea NRRL 2338]
MVEAAFDVIGERYVKETQELRAQRLAGQWVIDRLPARGARVLDLGCGTGFPTAEQFDGAGVEVVGVDESPRMLELAARRVPGARLVRGDMRALDAGLGDFDAVTAFFSLLMLSRAEVSAVLESVRDRLRGPRLLALAMVQGDSDAERMSFLGADLTVTAYSPRALGEVVSGAGFVVEELREVEVVCESDRPFAVEPQVFVYARAAG